MVIAIIGVLAGITVPRLLNTQSRQAENAVRGLEICLGVIAQRQVAGSFRMALWFDDERDRIVLETLRLPTDDRGRLVELGRRQAGEWRMDPLAPETFLGPLELREVLVDGEPVAGDWRIELLPGEPRPHMEFVAVAELDGRDQAWRVELLPHAIEPTVTKVGAGLAARGAASQSIDLDEIGLSEVDW